jgi:hypothetical protein
MCSTNFWQRISCEESGRERKKLPHFQLTAEQNLIFDDRGLGTNVMILKISWKKNLTQNTFAFFR